MPKAHPGVTLKQKSNGGHWNITWRDPRDQGKQKLKSSLTTVFDDATRIAKELSEIIHDPDQWAEPREGLQPRTYALWGARSLADRAGEAAMDVLLSLPAGRNARFVKGDGTLVSQQDIQEEWAVLLRKVESLSNERDQWRDRAIVAEGELRKMGKRILRDSTALDEPLGKAVDKYLAEFQGRDPDYATDVKYVLKAFAREFGEKKPLSVLQDREKQIDVWLSSIKRKKDNEPIGASRRVFIRGSVLGFLESAGLSVNRKGVRRPGRKEIRRDRGPIRWLEREQALKVVDALPGRHGDLRYWGDLFRLQVGTGLRPDELPTLKRGDFSEKWDHLTLSPLGKLTLKNGSRTIEVPKVLRGMLKKRFESGETLFPMKNGKPWRLQKSFDKAFGKALGVAEPKAGVGDLDARIGRRTCATLLLSAGVPLLTVARILGDTPETVAEHYGAVKPGTLDPSKAAI